MLSATGICSLVSVVVLIIVGHEAAPQGGVCTNITAGSSCKLKDNRYSQILPLSESISGCYCLR